MQLHSSSKAHATGSLKPHGATGPLKPHAAEAHAPQAKVGGDHSSAAGVGRLHQAKDHAAEAMPWDVKGHGHAHPDHHDHSGLEHVLPNHSGMASTNTGFPGASRSNRPAN